MSPRAASVSLSATLYKVGWIRLSAGAAAALGQGPIDRSPQRLPESSLLRVSLDWDAFTLQLTLRGGEGPFKLHVYHRTRTPIFLIISYAFFRSSKGLRVRATTKFPLDEVGERKLVLSRGGESLKVSRPRRKRR